MFESVRLEWQELSEKLDSYGQKEGQVKETDQHVIGIEQDVCLVTDSEHGLERGQVDSSSCIDSGEHASYLCSFFKIASEYEVTENDGDDNCRQSCQQCFQLLLCFF